MRTLHKLLRFQPDARHMTRRRRFLTVDLQLLRHAYTIRKGCLGNKKLIVLEKKTKFGFTLRGPAEVKT